MYTEGEKFARDQTRIGNKNRVKALQYVTMTTKTMQRVTYTHTHMHTVRPHRKISLFRVVAPLLGRFLVLFFPSATPVACARASFARVIGPTE